MIPGNLDPWVGPTDPDAEARALRLFHARQRPERQEACGCWAADCGECGPRRADGQRPPSGHVRLYALRQDARYLQARARHAARSLTQ